VVRHDQKIQRARKLGALAARGNNLLALGKTISVFWTEPGAERTGVNLKRLMLLRVA
jgi:hypothetical protein